MGGRTETDRRREQVREEEDVGFRNKRKRERKLSKKRGENREIQLINVNSYFLST